MNRMNRQPERFSQVPMAPGAAIRVACAGMHSYWDKRATANGAVGTNHDSPVDSGVLTTP